MTDRDEDLTRTEPAVDETTEPRAIQDEGRDSEAPSPRWSDLRNTDAHRYALQRSAAHMRELEERPVRGPDEEPPHPPPFRAKRLKRYTKLYEDAAKILLERGEVSMETNGSSPMRMWLRRFPDGSAVFEEECSGWWGLSTIGYLPDTVEAVAPMVEGSFFEARVRPIAGQEPQDGGSR